MRGFLPNLLVLASISSPSAPGLNRFERRVLRLVVLRRNRRQIAALLDQPVEAIGQCQAQLKRKAAATTLRGLARWARENRIA